MKSSDNRTGLDHCEKSSLVTRIAGLAEPPILTLVNEVERPSDVPDPLIQALVAKLPKANSVWALEDRAKWLRAAALIFNLIYERAESDSKAEEMQSDLKSVTKASA